MIKTKKQLNDCLKLDSANYLKRNNIWFKSFKNDLVTNPIKDQKHIWNYIKEMRVNEYYLNNSLLAESTHNSMFKRLLFTFFLILSNSKLKRLAYKTGFQIPPNMIEPGFTIWHLGAIIINPHAKIGRGCVLNLGAIIRHKVKELVPHIGDEAYYPYKFVWEF